MIIFSAILVVGATITPGWDFSLPVSVKPNPYAGLIWMDNKAQRPEIIQEGYTLSWAQLNPSEGVYDFSPVTKLLDAAQGRGCGVLLRLKCSDVRNKTPWGERPSMVPRWVLDKHKPVTVDMAGNRDSAYEDVTIHTAVPWDPGIQAEYSKFVEAFGKTGLQRHPALLGLYVHGISTSLGEEFWFDPRAFENLVKAGMTPEKLKGAFETRIKAWARAFGDQRGKLAWVGVGWIPAPDEEWEVYKAVQVSLNQLAVDEGLGTRGGGIERFDQLSDAAGQKLDAEGHLIQNWDHPILKEKRFYGDENEIYQQKGELGALMYRASTLRALQMGMRFLWTGDEAVSLDPAVSAYFNLTAGKSLAEAPDAWCWLLEMKGKKGSKEYVIRNFEKGLVQRESDGFRTRAVLPAGALKDFSGTKVPGFFTARSTDVNLGQKGIGLTVDSAFWNNSPPKNVTLKVTYLDNGSAWGVSYETVSGARESDKVLGLNDGLTKTATLVLSGFRPQIRGKIGFDIELLAGKGDLTVCFVRIIR